MRRASGWILLPVALVAGPGVVQGQVRPDAFQAALDSGRVALGAHGASAVVILPDGEAWTGVSGDAHAGTSVLQETVFEIGSVTKTFTAALAVALDEEGVLSLDDPLDRWVPDFPAAGGITLRQLLSHTSGLADAASHPGYIPAMIADPGRAWKPEDSFAYLGEPAGAPGEAFHYSSTGYLLAGLAIEEAAGRPLEELFRKRFFEPLALERTFFAAVEEPTGPAAHPYIDVDGDGSPEDLAAMVPSTSFRTAAWAAGAVVSSAPDLARWMRALHTGEVVSPDGYGEMTGFVDRPDGRRYGLGVLRDETDGTVRLGHEGNSAGFSAAGWHLPAEDVTVVVLTNAHLVRVEPVVAALLDVALDAGAESSAPGRMGGVPAR